MFEPNESNIESLKNIKGFLLLNEMSIFNPTILYIKKYGWKKWLNAMTYQYYKWHHITTLISVPVKWTRVILINIFSEVLRTPHILHNMNVTFLGSRENNKYNKRFIHVF